MPRNLAPAKKKPNPAPKPEKEPPALEPGEERAVPQVEEPAPIKEEPPAPPVQVIERRIETVTVEIPLGEPPHRFRHIHLEVLLQKEHAQTFARLRQALRDKDARTANGQSVRSAPDIIRWLMEQFADPT